MHRVMNDSVMYKCAYHNTSASMWFVTFGSACGFAISCVSIIRVSPVSCVFLARDWPTVESVWQATSTSCRCWGCCRMRRKRATCDSRQTKIRSSLDVLTANVTKVAVARIPQRPPFCAVSFPSPLRTGPLGQWRCNRAWWWRKLLVLFWNQILFFWIPKNINIFGNPNFFGNPKKKIWEKRRGKETRSVFVLDLKPSLQS